MQNIDFLFFFPKNSKQSKILTHNDRQRSYRADQCVFAKVFEQQMGSENKTSRKSSNFAFSSKNQSGRIGLKIYS